MTETEYTLTANHVAAAAAPGEVSVDLYENGSRLLGPDGDPDVLVVRIGGVTVRLTLANPQDRRTAAELLRRVHVATAYAYQRVTGYAMPPYQAIGPS